MTEIRTIEETFNKLNETHKHWRAVLKTLNFPIESAEHAEAIEQAALEAYEEMVKEIKDFCGEEAVNDYLQSIIDRISN
jgi:hypothetical protein